MAGLGDTRMLVQQVNTGPRCRACSRFRLTSDGENYDTLCVCGHNNGAPKIIENGGTEVQMDDLDLDLEIQRMQGEVKTLLEGGVPNARWERDLAWLRELQLRRMDQALSRALGLPWGDSKDLDAEIKRMENEGDLAPDLAPRWQHGLSWLRELRKRRSAVYLGLSPQALQRTVTCAWCGNHYRSACPSALDRGLQGSHCASDIVQEDGAWYVRGSYGSDEHDMHRYLFVANPPAAPADPVCDECISERLMAGDLRDTGPECERRPADFGPRPLGTWGLVQQIKKLAEARVAMRQLVTEACATHEGVHSAEDPCKLCTAIREYRKYQRWSGDLWDEGEKYSEGCPEVADQLRAAAKDLERLAVFWESQREESP